ncbi:ATP-binding protein [Thermoactinospora rubra]|uniref:ATP-binding protein n=1 Tax=Thermoactinospora rubra TaxID=1088767 RepID=UPI001301A1D5|nr:LuxR family transcriptional regulator [Thermoactinospora rubra]
MTEHSGWPFVGRAQLLARVRGELRDGPGVMIAGAAGVGKSRLAAEAVAGRPAVRAVATQTASIIPFGAFAHLMVGAVPAGENLLRWAEGQLAAHGSRGELLISVDDAHWLDPASAALLHHLATQGSARLLVTVRRTEPLPGPVAALWQHELLTRVEVEPLTPREVGEVLAGVLGGQVSSPTVAKLAAVSGGNLLYLRELVQAGRAQGRLRRVGGVWGWYGELSVTTRLRELVSDRIGHLDPLEREALELVAFGEPVGTQVVAALTAPEAVERLEDRGLVTGLVDGRRLLLRLGHPLYGEIVRSGCGALRTRRLRRLLAEAAEATGLRRREDLLRAAVWRLDSGSAADGRMLLEAAYRAWGVQDTRLATRLARAAVDMGAGAEAVALLGHALAVVGDTAEAKKLLRLLQSAPLTEAERAQQAQALCFALCMSGEEEEARQALDDVLGVLTEPEWRQEVLVYRGVTEFCLGRLDEARRTHAQAVATGPLTRQGRAHAMALEGWLAAHTGRTTRAVALAEELLSSVEEWRDLAVHALPVALDVACAAHLFAGDLDGAARAVASVETLVGSANVAQMSVSGFGAHGGMVSRLRGQAAEALRACREDADLLHPRSPYLARTLAELAKAAALLGDPQTARQALAGAEVIPVRWSFTDQPVRLARSWVSAADGDLDTAVDEALAAADVAGKRGMAGYEMLARYDAARFGGAPLVVDRLEELAQQVDGPLAGLCARHARALVSRDAAGLRAVAEEFERLGMLLFAAEAAAHEADALHRAGRGMAARGAQTRAWALARRCPGARTPALVGLVAPDLTPRQREIVHLVVRELTNRQIAAQLGLSIRTVGNHLQAIYDKLGVNSRAELSRLLGE